ncbi:MAG: glycosyltransferase family 2 protein, partial [Anaerolineales bacterium]|nr:glycosyltransferase family 2 protein [Anaerolineales bacterium]
PRTRIIINSFSHLWQIPLTVARWLGLATPNLPQNWLTVEDITNLLQLTGYEVIRTWPEIIWPLPTPLVDKICNRFLAKLWPFKHLSLTNIIVARPAPEHRRQKGASKVSVVVPARNEEGNIRNIFGRLPTMGKGTELIFVEGHSQDNTYEAIETAMADYPDLNPTLVKQTGTGKGDAVRQGFALASGDILMILDADLTVPPEDLISFYEVLQDGIGEFVNGVRLVYPMEDQAMRYLNYIGNKFFGLVFSWLLGQPIKDTLCGTKALWRADYEWIAANRNYFGDFDPFGDFDLLLGAVKQNLKIVDLPIRYEERTYGSTNIQRWRHGVLLLKMAIFAARRLKFV